jgi:1-acyl-sn-glycerol-3-phosphate acyltransferase
VRSGELNGWWSVGVRITHPLVRLLFRVRVEGQEHVPSRGPAILAFNHVSVLDGPCLAIETAWRTGREARFLVAAEVFRRFFLGWVLRRFEQIPIRRGEADIDALGEAIATVRAGAVAAIAPEGRINDDGAGELQRVRRGIARVALPTGAAVIPVGVWGTQTRWPRSGLRFGRPWRPRLALAFGHPILPSGEPTWEADTDPFVRRVESALARQVDRARELAGPREP